jgi:tetrapyrrole methylase family protein/MazG family protein
MEGAFQLVSQPERRPVLLAKEGLDSFETLKNIMSTLRQPGGCPWDREQTSVSLKPYLIEEAYEVVEAIESGDPKRLCEELGDLLLQVVFLAQIGVDKKDFNMRDVLQGINTKLLHRHPHVFGNERAENAAEVCQRWEDLKRKEKGGEGSLLDGIPRSMPALSYSKALQERAARVGFDWPDIEGVIDKVAEESRELKQVADRERRVEEFGDLLFALVNVGRHLEVDPEEALGRTNQRFRERFAYIEKTCREQGVAIHSLSLGEMEQLWQEAKKRQCRED